MFIKRSLSIVLFLVVIFTKACLIGMLHAGETNQGISGQNSLTLADSPWPMFHHDLQHTGRSGTAGPQEANLKWIFETGDDIISSPVVGPRRIIYLGSKDGNLYSLMPGGIEQWSFYAGDEVSTTPSVYSNGDIVFYAGGYLYCLNEDGDEKWRYDVVTGGSPSDVYLEINIFSLSPVIGPDGNIYVGGSEDTNWGLLSVDAAGDKRWFQPDVNISSQAAFSPDGGLYVLQNSKLFSVNPEDGSINWEQLPCDPLVPSRCFTTMVDTSPVIDDLGNIIFADWERCIFSLSGINGYTWWFKAVGGGEIHSTPALIQSGDLIVVTTYRGASGAGGAGELFSIDSEYGWLVNWTSDEMEVGTKSSPAVDGEGNIFIGSWDTNIYAFDSSGKKLWSYPTDGWIWSSPALDNKGNLYVGSYDNKLYAIGEWHEVEADFSSKRVCGDPFLPMRFYDESEGDPTAWHWDFGNGETSTEPFPTTTYIFPGVYKVTLKVSNSLGESTITKEVTVPLECQGATLSGLVRNQDGELLPLSFLFLLKLDAFYFRIAISDFNGNYLIDDLPEGKYSLMCLSLLHFPRHYIFYLAAEEEKEINFDLDCLWCIF